MVNIKTQRLTIVRLTHQDTDFISQLVNEPNFIRYIGDKKVVDRPSAIAYLNQGPLASYQRHSFGLYKVSLDDGTPIGVCGLLKRDELEVPDLGFAFLKKYNGLGYAFEAAKAVLCYERQHHSYALICAITAIDNQPSMALLAKLGFELVIGQGRPDCGMFEPANYFELTFTQAD